MIRALALAAVLTLAALPAYAGPVEDIHAATNAERAKHGLAPLARSRCLDDTAQKWTDHMAYEGRLAHSEMDVLMTTCDLTASGENVAFNSPADVVVADWMASEGHRVNILNPAYTTLGVGWNGAYATQQFGTGKASAPTRTPVRSGGLASTGAGR